MRVMMKTTFLSQQYNTVVIIICSLTVLLLVRSTSRHFQTCNSLVVLTPYTACMFSWSAQSITVHRMTCCSTVQPIPDICNMIVAQQGFPKFINCYHLPEWAPEHTEHVYVQL